MTILINDCVRIKGVQHDNVEASFSREEESVGSMFAPDLGKHRSLVVRLNSVKCLCDECEPTGLILQAFQLPKDEVEAIEDQIERLI